MQMKTVISQNVATWDIFLELNALQSSYLSILNIHYENLPIQYTEIFSVVKIKNFVGKIMIFLIYLFITLIVGTR